MDFFFPDDDLERKPPEETHITALSADPYPDGRRLRVHFSITPFQARPHIELVLRDASGEEVATASVVEPMSWNLELTLHLRGALNSPYTLDARLYYPDGPADEPVRITFEVTPPDPGNPPA